MTRQLEPITERTVDLSTGLPRGTRLLAARHDGVDTDDATSHELRFGPAPSPAGLIAAVTAAGLRGRGGGGFPTGRKLAAVAEAAALRRRPIVVANGCEGEPASAKDATLLHCAPHLVLDGVVLAAQALRATRAVVAVHAGSAAADRLRRALAERTDPLRVRIAEIPDRYVASEESALVQHLNGGPALPTASPPRPAQRGVGGSPTLVDNVETLAHLALIARYGPDWFREVGTPELPGSLLVTVGGAVRWPGVYEVPAGTSVGTALDVAGGPVGVVQAVLSGGFAGGWLRLPDALDVPLTHDALRDAGAALGVPMLLALPAGACGLAQTSHLLDFLAAESAGQCGPCAFGLPALADAFTAVVAGSRTAPDELRRAGRLADSIAGRGACAHPNGATRLVRSALPAFPADLVAHLAGRPCPAAAGPPLLVGGFR
jgi:NADH:ubiquinone oxidoreductase subunit F (NADH-binding)